MRFDGLPWLSLYQANINMAAQFSSIVAFKAIRKILACSATFGGLETADRTSSGESKL